MYLERKKNPLTDLLALVWWTDVLGITDHNELVCRKFHLVRQVRPARPVVPSLLIIMKLKLTPN